MAERESAVLIAAHPYRRRFLEEPAEHAQARAEMLDRAAGDSFFQMCHAIEGVNGRGTSTQNMFSRSLGELIGAQMSGGSDAHRAEHLGIAATLFERPIFDLGDLISELRQGRFRPMDLRTGP